MVDSYKMSLNYKKYILNGGENTIDKGIES